MCRTWLGVALVALLVLPACGRADAPAGGRRTATGPGLSGWSSDMELHGVRWIDGQGREMSGPPELGRGDRSVLFFDVAAKRTKADLEAFAAFTPPWLYQRPQSTIHAELAALKEEVRG